MEVPQPDAHVLRVARLVEAGGETDVAVLDQHTGHLLFQEAEAILAAGQDLQHCARAAAKMIKGANGMWIMSGARKSALRLHSSMAGVLAQDMTATQATAAASLISDITTTEAPLLSPAKMLAGTAFLGFGLSIVDEQFGTLLEGLIETANICAASPPGELDSQFAELGADINAKELEMYCLSMLKRGTASACPERRERVALAERYAELNPGPRGAMEVAGAYCQAGDMQQCYQTALRAILALTPDSSSYAAFRLSKYAIEAIRYGALGATWSWSQLEPLVARMETAGQRMRRWMLPVVWDGAGKQDLDYYRALKRLVGDRRQW